MATAADLIIRSRGPWLTFDTGAPVPRRGPEMNELGERADLALAVRDGLIAAIGPADEIRAAWRGPMEDLGDLLVMPGFVDPHTHPVFHGTREAEFELRNGGRSYVEIAQAGGGIRNSVRRLREADEDTLAEELRARCDRFLALGTTTVEAKSGYGLSLEDEARSLRAIRRIDARHPLDLVPTFLGAHEIPDEYREDREGYLRLLVEEMIPTIAEAGLADFCDVFCEDHVFSVDESRRILLAARAAGLRLRIHADEIAPTGGAELAAELGADSADHLVAASDAGIAAMAAAGVTAVLLPGTSFFLNLPRHARGRAMIDAGCPVALATDYNPGSCHTQSMPMILTLACLHYGFTAAESLCAATVNAAASLGLGERRGRLAVGMDADLIALDAPNARFIPYQFGDNLVRTVVKAGRVVLRRPPLAIGAGA
ncbi:MAG: imidazolonepropionase [Planctomycetota bacterium]